MVFWDETSLEDTRGLGVYLSMVLDEEVYVRLEIKGNSGLGSSTHSPVV